MFLKISVYGLILFVLILCSQLNQVNTVNGPESNLNGFSASWNALDMDSNGRNFNANGVVSITNSLIKDSVNGNIERDDDDDGLPLIIERSDAQIITPIITCLIFVSQVF